MCPDYYPGKEPDSSTVPLPDSDKEWEGALSFTDESKWNGGFCMTTAIANSSTKQASDFKITLTTKNCQITTLWGLKIESSSQGKITLVPDSDVLIRPGKVGLVLVTDIDILGFRPVWEILLQLFRERNCEANESRLVMALFVEFRKSA